MLCCLPSRRCGSGSQGAKTEEVLFTITPHEYVLPTSAPLGSAMVCMRVLPQNSYVQILMPNVTVGL